MALQGWIGRSAGQIDADSPCDTVLFEGINLDIWHLRQILYGDGAGDFRTPIDGHNHITTNSAPLGTNTVGTTQIIDDAISTAKIFNDQVTTAKIADDNVTYDKLKQATSSWDVTVITASWKIVDINQDMAHWPQMKSDLAGRITVFGGASGAAGDGNFLTGAYTHQIWAYNNHGFNEDWQGESVYHSNSEQIIQIYRNADDRITGVMVTDSKHPGGLSGRDKNNNITSDKMEVLTYDTHPELFISKKDKRVKMVAEEIRKTVSHDKLKIKKSIT